MDQTTGYKHFLFAAGVLWGHVRPAQGFCIRILQLNPKLRITLFLSGRVGHKAQVERERYDLASVKDRLKVIHVLSGAEEGAALVGSEEYPRVIGQLIEDFNEWYPKVLKGEPILDTITQTPVQAFTPLPSVVFGDISILTCCDAVPKISKELGAPKPLFLIFLPYGMSGLFWAYSEVFTDLVKKVGTYDDLAKGYDDCFLNNDTIVNLPGLFPFHVYEHDPNFSTLPYYELYNMFTEVTPRTDGVVTVWPRGFSDAYQSVFAKIAPDVSLYNPGPQLPEVTGMRKTDFAIETKPGEIISFLDDQLRTLGKHSVIYISFGSLCYSPRPPQLLLFLDVLDSLSIPYILALGGAPPDLAKTIPDRMNASKGRGLLCPWVPQFAVLQHEATLAFVTHGGSNGVMESIISGVPMIMWPSCWDQPDMANEMCYRGVAYELFQVRNDHNIGKPTARGPIVEGTSEAMQAEFEDILTKLRGDEGDDMREKVKALGKELERDAAESGASHAEMVRISKLGD